jgi:hypothetical protein
MAGATVIRMRFMLRVHIVGTREEHVSSSADLLDKSGQRIDFVSPVKRTYKEPLDNVLLNMRWLRRRG